MGTSSTGIHLWAAVCLVLLQHPAVTVTASSCSAGCKGGASNYPAGHVYVYEIEGSTRTTLPDTSDEAVTLQIRAIAEVSGTRDCSVALKLKDVRVTGPGGKKYESLRELEQHPVSFTSSDGKVDSQLCAAEAENAAALNIKRAVISLLQVFAKQSGKVYEWDVFGKCPSSVIVEGSKKDNLVTLTRDLNECYQRESINHRFQSTPYYTQSGVQSSPLLAATQSVTQKVVNGFVESAFSTETYLFRPLSNQGSGAKTVVQTKLTLKSQRGGAVQAGGATVGRSIVFELPRDGSSHGVGAEDVVKALKRAADTMVVTVSEESAKEFRSLVKIVRKASKDDLLTVYSQVKSGAGFSHSPKKLFQDALLQAGTGEAVEVAVELLKNNEIKGDLAKAWYVALSFVPQPSLNSLAAVSTLLDETDLSYHAYFGIGSLARRYCSNHNCEGNAVFAGLLNKLARNIAGGCKVSSRAQEDKLITSLKALGNVHHLTDSVSTIVQRCYADSSAPTRVRVAALETALTDACKSKKTALTLLENTQEDSELRIKAYLVVVQCPNGKTANSLKQLLEKEKINQVGSFIVSHLRNLRATTNPERQLAKEQLQEVRTTHRFPEDFRKFSRNMELSYLLDGINLGYSGESNTIHSQKSFLPRSVSFNVTSHVFGHSFNILEVGLRAENVERILERYFGPRGFYSVTEPEEVLETNRGRFLNILDHIQKRLKPTTRARAKRSTNKQLSSTLKRATKSLGPDYDDNHIDLDVSTKVFGSEVGWKNIGDCLEDFTPEKAVDEFFSFVNEGVKESKEIDVDLRHHATFLEVELAYPTAVGLPLKLVASGSAAVHLEVKSNLDLPAVLDNPDNFEFQIKVVPSTAIEVTGELLIDAYVVESGLKVLGRAHTATGTDIKVKALGGKTLDMQVRLPLKKQDLVNIKSEVVSTVRERDGTEQNKELTFKTERKEYEGCFNQLANAVGLTFCGSISLPWEDRKTAHASFPLSGPSALLIQMEAKDVPYYHIVIKKNLDNQYNGVVGLLFDTPGSQTKRQTEVVLTKVLQPEYKLAVSFSSPQKSLSASVYEVDDAHEYSWNAQFELDQQEYFARIGAKISGSESHRVYTPLLEYRLPGQTHQLSGGQTDNGFGCKGTVTVDKTDSLQKYTLQGVTIQVPQGYLTVDGTITRQKNLYESDLTFTTKDDVIKYKSKVAQSSPSKFSVEVQQQSRKYPDYGFSYKWDYHREENLLENSLVVTHGRDLRSEKSRITIKQSAKYLFENIYNFNLVGENTVEYPLYGLSVELKGAATPKTLSYDLEFEYEKYKIGSELDFKRDSKKSGDFDLQFSVEAGEKSLELDLKREVTGTDKSKITALLEMKPGSKYELSTDLVHAVEMNDINVHQSSVLKVSSHHDDIKFTSGFVMNSKELEFLTELKSGRKQHIDIKWNFNKAADNPSGNIKVFVNGLVDANAQYKYVPGGKIGATLNIDLPKQGRKIKGTADLTITGTNHVASLDLFWDMGRDPSRKLHFASESDIKANSIDSKNTLVLLQEKITVNFKGSLTGKFKNGHLIGELDLTLPKGDQLVLKIDRNLKRTDDRFELEAKGDVVLRDAQGGTNSLSIDGKVIAESKNVLLDSFLRLVLKTSKGKDLSIYLKLKDTPAREKRELEGQLDVNSSQFDPLKLGASADVTQKDVTFKAHCSYGSEVAVSTAGTLGLGNDGKVLVYDKEKDEIVSLEFTLENTLDVKLPTDKIRTAKYYTNMDVALNKDTAKIDSLDDITVNGDANYKLIIRVDAQPSSGTSQIEVSLPSDKPRSLAATWHSSTENDILKKGGTLTAKWGDKQEAVTTVELAGPKDGSGIDLHLTSSAPKLGKADLKFQGKVSRVSPKYIQTHLVSVVNDNKLEFEGKLSESSFKFFPNIDVKSVSPYGTTKFYVNLKQKSENEVVGDLEIQWVVGKGGRLTINGEAKLEAIDNFYIELNADSEALEVNKWVVTAQSKRAKGRNTIQVSATSAGKNVIDGRLNYNFVEKQNYNQFVAGGILKLYEKNTQTKLDVSLAHFTEEANQKVGSELKVKFNLGEKSFEGVYRLTSSELYVYHEICKKQGQCSMTKLTSESHVDKEKQELTHSMVLIVDLRKAGVPERVEVSSTIAITQEIPFDQKLEILLINDKKISYKAHAYVQKEESGVVITFPERVVAGKVQHHTNVDEKTGSVDVSIVGNVWLDQIRQPDLKTGFIIKYTADVKPNDVKIISEAKFTHPSLGKDYSIKSNAVIGSAAANIIDATVDLDLFQRADQAIKITIQSKRTSLGDGDKTNGAVKITSKGLNLDISLVGYTEITAKGIDSETTFNYIDVKHATKQLIAKLLANKNGLTIKVKGPDSDLLFVDGKVQWPDCNTVKTQTLIKVVDIEPVMLIVDAKSTPTIFIQFYKQRLPTAKGEIALVGDIFSELALRAHTINDGVRKELINVQISLTESKFLKSTFSWSTENFVKFLEVCSSELGIQKHLKDAAIALRKEAQTELKDLVSVLQRARPDLKPLLQSYQKQLREIRDEIAKDEGLKELSQYVTRLIARLRSSIAGLLETITEALHTLTERLEKLHNSVTEVWEKLLPEFEKSFDKVVEVLTGVLEDVEGVLLTYVRIVAKIIQSHEEDLKKLAAVFADVLEEVGKVIGKTVIELRNDIKEFVDVLVQQIQSLPKFDALKELLNQLKEEINALSLPEQIWIILEEFMLAAMDMAPTPEVKAFIDSLDKYVKKHLNRETVDELDELQALASKAALAVKSLITLVRSYLGETKEGPTLLGFQLPTTLVDILKIPRLLVFRFSPLKYFTSEDLPSWEELLITYRPRLNPLDWFPPYEAIGIVVDGQHYFTFDHRHFTFKGSCPYILATDVVDGNFSVVLNVENGKFKSLLLTDGKDSIEAQEDRTILVNGQASEFPVQAGGLTAWRRYHWLSFKSDSGVLIDQDYDTGAIRIRVSGFYFGRTRGLLGTLSYEQGDDFLQSNGELTENVNDFANSWKVGQCQDVPGAAHTAPKAAQCTELFTSGSILSLGFPFISPVQYREACDLAVESAGSDDAKNKAACQIATAYIVAAYQDGILIRLPDKCGQCDVVGQSPVEAGSQFSVRTAHAPHKAADIVIVLEQSQAAEELYKELVIPLVQALTNDLKSKGITDVVIHLMGWSDAQEWPQHYTTGGKLVFEGRIKNIRFYKNRERNTRHGLGDQILWFIHQLEVELGLTHLADATLEVLNYPYRAGASKTLIYVLGQPAEPGELTGGLLQTLGVAVMQQLLSIQGIVPFVITPVEDLRLTTKNTKAVDNVVGFDDERVYSLTDGKRKQGNAELRRLLEYKPNPATWLPQGANGVTFVSQNFIKNKSQRRLYLQIVTHRISEALTVEFYEDCICVIRDGLYAESFCRVTGRKERETKTKPKTKG